MNLTQELTNLIGAESIFVDTALTVDDQRPQIVVAPSSVEASAEVLRFAGREKLKVLPCGAATQLHIGNPGSSIDVVLSTARLNAVIEYEPADLTILTGAGLSFFNFFNETSRHNQWLPIDAPSGESTIGGLAATNACGPLRAHYGAMRDYVIGLKILLADGSLIKAGGRVVKNVAGYDMTKLFIGSFGTLGVIVEVGLKLRPLPEAETTCLLLSNRLEPLTALAIQLGKSELLPIAVELLDARALRLCELTPGTGEWALLIRFGESSEALNYQLERLQQLAYKQGHIACETLDEPTARQAWQLLNALEHNFGAEVTLSAAILPAQLDKFVNDVHDRLKTGGPRFLITGHAINGSAQIFIKDFHESQPAQQRIIQTIKELRAAWQKQASIVIQRAPLLLKREVEVWGKNDSSVELMRGLKAKFDPTGIFVSGRFAGGI